MVNVGWLQQDISTIGGAEMSCQALMDGVPSWATIIPCPYNKRPSQDIDIFVIENSVTYGAQWIEELALKPVIRQVRDPWYAGSATLRRWILDNAALLIFSSPIQRDDVQKRYPFDRPTAVIPVPIDLQPFRDAARPLNERQGAVFVGRIDVFKGAGSVVDWALRTKTPLTMIGENRFMGFGALPAYIRIIGSVPYEQMPEILGKARTYIAMPEWPEAFGRSVVEAWAAGCELIIEGRVGADWWLDNAPERLGYDGPVQEFWDAVEGVL